MKNSLILFLFSAFLSCQNDNKTAVLASKTNETASFSLEKIADIPLPKGFKRAETNDFGTFLRQLKLKKDKTVYLYDGRLKGNQSAQFAVLDVSVGNRDLQQCADAVMRLRADFLFEKKQFDAIKFSDGEGFVMDFGKWASGNRIVFSQNKLHWEARKTCNASELSFKNYLNVVFAFAGTATLSKELTPLSKVSDMEVGNVFIKGGSPGHAVIVVDVAVNSEGKKVFLLAQSYMPAQDIHVLKNPSDLTLSPWYSTDFGDVLATPEWNFKKEQLKKF